MSSKQIVRYHRALTLIMVIAFLLTVPAFIIITGVHGKDPTGALRCEIAAMCVNAAAILLILTTVRLYDRAFRASYPEVWAAMEDASSERQTYETMSGMTDAAKDAWFRRKVFMNDARYSLLFPIILTAILFGCRIMT